MARPKKKIDGDLNEAPAKGAFSLSGFPVDEAGMILEAVENSGLSLDEVQTARVRHLDINNNRMVIIMTVDDVRIRYPIAVPQAEV